MLRIFIIIIALVSTITADAQKFSKEQLLEDYDYYFSQLEQIHPDPYTAFGGKEAFHQAVRNLRDKLAKRDSLTLDEMKFEGNALLSTLHDGHTNMGWAEIPETMPEAYLPLRFRVIPDGIIVNGALPEWKSLIGAYVREVGGLSLDSVLARIDHISTSENRFGQYKVAPGFIRYNNTVKLLFPNFDGKQLSMKLSQMNGRDTLVCLPFYPNGPRWGSFIYAPEDSRFPKGNFEYRFVDDQKQTMVIRINQVISSDIPDKSLRAEDDGEHQSSDTTETEAPRVIVADVFARMLREMKAEGCNRLIIDLRGNGGGWTSIMYAAFYELFGQRFFDTDMSFHYATKLSEMFLKKNGITLEQFNEKRGTNFSLGDFSVERKIESFDEFRCADISLLKSLDGKSVYTPKEIYVVTDEHTFSAAFHITYMMWRMGAKVVGVPSSQAPNTFMEVTPFNLPNSGLECSVSNSLQRCFPDNDPRAKVFTPDILLSYDDYRKYNFSNDAELLYLIDKISVDAQNEVAGGCIKKGATESDINATNRFPMYSVMKFPQALYVADFLIRNNIDLNTEVQVRKDELLQDTWSPMLSTFEDQRTFTYSELLALSLQQSDNNACDILFKRCGGPRAVEKYIRNLGFKDIRIQKTEKQMHDTPALSEKNWCTPQSMVALLEWFIAHHNDNEPLCYIWKLMEECQTGGDCLPAAVPNSAKVIHKTGTGYPLPSGQPSGICDVGIIILDNGQQLPIAVFITAPSSQSRISDVAKQLLEQ